LRDALQRIADQKPNGKGYYIDQDGEAIPISQKYHHSVYTAREALAAANAYLEGR
jgi:hypothetical protein